MQTKYTRQNHLRVRLYHKDMGANFFVVYSWHCVCIPALTHIQGRAAVITVSLHLGQWCAQKLAIFFYLI